MRFHFPVTLLAAVLAAACAAPGADGFDAGGADVVLLGELHDAEPHRDLQHQWVNELVRRRQLAALAIEMAERGYGTAGLARGASEAEVRKALGWNANAWQWSRYSPAVMAAVRAGVPVVGANLPNDEIKPAMNNTAWDGVLPAAAWQKQLEAIRVGHCNLLPTPQLPVMARVQVARDFSMATAIKAALVPGKTVLLLAGGGHADAELGVPRHLPPHLAVRPVQLPPPPAKAGAPDYCEELRNRKLPSLVDGN
jgi:uncharacterized iron-regulated protein